MEKNEQLFTDGFNNGYLIAKHEPELSKKLITANSNEDNDYFSGLVSGKREFEMEKVKGRLKGISKNSSPAKDTKSKDKEM